MSVISQYLGDTMVIYSGCTMFRTITCLLIHDTTDTIVWRSLGHLYLWLHYGYKEKHV